MCFSGGSSAAQSTSTVTSNTSVTVNPTTNFSIDTSDLADAVNTLAQSEQTAGLYEAAGEIGAAQITAQAQSGISGTTVILIIVAVVGLGFTAGFIKLPARLRA